MAVTIVTKPCIPPYVTGMILGLRPANARPRYKVTPSLIGWSQTLNQPCNMVLYGGDVSLHWQQGKCQYMHELVHGSEWSSGFMTS